MWATLSALFASVDFVVTLVALVGFVLMFLTGGLPIRRGPGEGLVAVVMAAGTRKAATLRQI